MTEHTKNPDPSALIAALRLPEGERVTGGGFSRLTKFVGLVLLLILVGGGIAAYRENPVWLQEMRGIEYETAVVTAKEKDDVAISASGYVVPYRMLNVSPRVPGTITQLNFDVGQKVKKGDLLAQLDDISVQADVQQAEAAALAARSRLEEAQNGALPEEISQAESAVAVGESKLELVENELGRARQLSDSTTLAELDQLESSRKDAEAQVASLRDKLKLIKEGLRPERIKALKADVQQAEAVVTKARYFLENTRIYAPLDGTILEKNAEVGEILRPEVLSVSLCKLADMSIMEVEIDVQERELPNVEIGRPCQIIPDAYPDKEYSGRIDRVQPIVIRARGVVRVTLRIDEPDQYLLPEMNVRVTIKQAAETGSQPASLWIPEVAVVTEGDTKRVFVVENNFARAREVELGATEGRRVEVLAGLKVDEVVVLPGDERLVDGQSIRRREAK